MVGFWVITLAFVCIIYIYVCPYNKVEESFNTQAVHDLIYHKWTDLDAYDHLEFPGVVPRSFIGPLVLWLQTSTVVNVINIPKTLVHCYVRGMLGLSNLFAFYLFVNSIGKQFGGNTARWTAVVTGCQFHFLFYISRTLPNSFALVLSQLALCGWVSGNSPLLIASALSCILVFRGELVLLLGTLILYSLALKQIKPLTLIQWSLITGSIALASTVLIDSYFWQRWVWPEGEVMWYNTVLNKSSQWGTAPFFWYFYSALPRMLLVALPFSLISLYYDTRCIKLLSPAVLFIFLFSFLPHKELRFIIYTIPLFNATAGRALDYIQNIKGMFGSILRLHSVCCMIVSLAISLSFLIASQLNYPGGVAFSRLHEIGAVRRGDEVRVHICVEAAQTGVSRFGEVYDSWVYSKAEDKETDLDFMKQFTWIITTKDKLEKYHNTTHRLSEEIEGYDGISWDIKTPFILPKVKLRTKLVIAVRNQ